mmetsp:Transcript_6167/g.15220  ORF Transcript_6167/g.15220 Transcript_6167/m.15220 type:complete len:288 (-) Transcript_6167:9308-10171(-)
MQKAIVHGDLLTGIVEGGIHFGTIRGGVKGNVIDGSVALQRVKGSLMVGHIERSVCLPEALGNVHVQLQHPKALYLYENQETAYPSSASWGIDAHPSIQTIVEPATDSASPERCLWNNASGHSEPSLSSVWNVENEYDGNREFDVQDERSSLFRHAVRENLFSVPPAVVHVPSLAVVPGRSTFLSRERSSHRWNDPTSTLATQFRFLDAVPGADVSKERESSPSSCPSSSASSSLIPLLPFSDTYNVQQRSSTMSQHTCPVFVVSRDGHRRQIWPLSSSQRQVISAI